MPAEKPALTVQFDDVESGGKGLVVIRVIDDIVAVGLSVEADGDLDIAMSKHDFQRLIEALQRAVPNSDGFH